MGERMTAVYLPGADDPGYAVHGKQSAGYMVAAILRHAAYMKKCAEEVLAANPDDFRVETYTGVHVRKNLTVLQSGREPYGS